MKYWNVVETEPNVVKVSIKKEYSRMNLFYSDSQIIYFYQISFVGIFSVTPIRAKFFFEPSRFFEWFYRIEPMENTYLNQLKTDFEKEVIPFPTNAFIQANFFEGVYFSYKNQNAKNKLLSLLDAAIEKQASEIKRKYNLSNLSEL